MAEKRDSLVLGGPLEHAHDRGHEEAFHFKIDGYRAGVAWDRTASNAPCLNVSVERSQLANLPDFRASGCVSTDAPSTTVAKIDRPGGGEIEVVVWFFDGPTYPR